MSFSDALVGAAVQPCPPASTDTPEYWIEIELKNDDNQPVAFEEYLVILPDGTHVPGFLDHDGFARLENIATGGTGQVCFPRLSADSWQKTATLPAKAAGT